MRRHISGFTNEETPALITDKKVGGRYLSACREHHRLWEEGALWTEAGGTACRECITTHERSVGRIPDTIQVYESGFGEPVRGTARVGNDTYTFTNNAIYVDDGTLVANTGNVLRTTYTTTYA